MQNGRPFGRPFLFLQVILKHWCSDIALQNRNSGA